MTAGDRLHERVDGRIEALLDACDPGAVDEAEFWAAQFDHGLAWVDFPEGRGGMAASARLQPQVDERLRAAGAPANWPRNPIGLGVAGPALVAHGRADQAERHLRPLFTCAEVWCQLYSEPAAGSDLAAVTTTATRAGDGWVVTGEKWWITLAHVARWALLLARTEPDLPKHAGLTCFIVDMNAPGVTVRPVRQMTGQAEFDEVILSGVRVADGQRLGPVGGGWDVARGTLARERAAIGGLAETRGRQALETALRLWWERPDHDPALRDRLTALWIDAEVAGLTSRKSPHPAVAKLLYAELNQRIHQFCLALLGPDALLYDSYAMDVPDRMGTAGDDVAKAFLRSRANTIEAGTSEVLRTLLAERALGLPRDR